MSIKKKKKTAKKNMTMAVTIWTKLEKGLKGSLIGNASQGLRIINELKNLDAKY